MGFSGADRTALMIDGVKKTKAKKSIARKTPKPKTRTTKTDTSASLQSRLEVAFAQAVWNAKSYVNDPARLRSLFEEASKQATSLPKDSFHDTWPYLQTMLRLIRAYY